MADPCVHLWVNESESGDVWRDMDVLALHNRRYLSVQIDPAHNLRYSSSAYGGIVEIEPNVVLLLYDYLPNGWNPASPKTSVIL